ncbi:hypothetical protein FIBSPDRAFT_967293 [Athelia psychrophila]|uniref:Uncharacterized protein n=1 Tax=Athelia psychrophila TaxID=1759441 RepID=A0A167VVP9_9AGAM|nr:hypothetical protein FIBSPDRAFT_967293 [Fibularhizoctonia sp. CBS 109695]
MDHCYDFEAANQSLVALAKVRGEEASTTLAETIEMDGTSAYHTDKPKCWKLATMDPESGDKEEVVITIQGIICQKPSSHSIHFVRQQIQLTSLECPIFKRTMQTIQRLDHLLSQQVPDGKMDPLQLPSAFGDTALKPGNRYFTARRDDPDSRDLPFDPAVDPKGFLEVICHK